MGKMLQKAAVKTDGTKADFAKYAHHVEGNDHPDLKYHNFRKACLKNDKENQPEFTYDNWNQSWIQDRSEHSGTSSTVTIETTKEKLNLSNVTKGSLLIPADNNNLDTCADRVLKNFGITDPEDAEDFSYASKYYYTKSKEEVLDLGCTRVRKKSKTT